MKMGLEEALADCLTSLERGGSIEECLARYPGLARELEPLLLTATGLQQAYDLGPRPSFQRAALQRFLAAAASRGRQPLAVAPPPRRFSFGWRWVPAAVGAPALAGAIALAVVLGLSGGGSSPEGVMTVRQLPAPSATETVPAPEPEEIERLVLRLEEQLDQMQEQVAQGEVIPSEDIQTLKDINQSIEQTLPAAPPEAVEAQPQIAGLLDQQQTLLNAATEQNQVAPEAADDVDEVIRIAGTIQELLLPTVTPTPTATPAPTETPASSATASATPEAVEAQPQIAGLLEQQQTLLSEATEQNQVAPEAADDVDEVIRIAGTIQELLLPTVTPTPTPTPAPTESPASSATATPEASAIPTVTPVSSPGPGAAGSETIVPLTPTPSP